MFYFTIDSDLNVAAVEKPIDPDVETDKVCFRSKEELLRIGANWPGSKLVTLWNSFAGLPGFQDCKPVKKVRTVSDMLNRIWNAVQRLADPRLGPTEEEIAAAEANKEGEEMATKTKRVRKPKAAKAVKVAKPAAAKKAKSVKVTAASNGNGAPPRPGTKLAQVVAMLQRKNGATLEQIMERMGWQKNTVGGMIHGSINRAAIRTTGKAITNYKPEGGGDRVYIIAE
jgi:hypothetical protein